MAEKDNDTIAKTGKLSKVSPEMDGDNSAQFAPLRSIGHAQSAYLVSSCLKISYSRLL